MKRLNIFLFIIIIVSLSSCISDSPTATKPIASTIETPTEISLGTETPLPVSENTQTIVTLTPTLSPTQTPKANLSTEGPWLVYMGSSGLMGINQDGSGLTILIDESESDGVLLGPGSPSGDYCLLRLGDPDNFFSDLALYLIHMPTGELIEVSSLLPVDLSKDELDWETEEIYAVVQSQPAWSPSGEQIAFVAVIEGSSSDLYIYDMNKDTRTRLTSGSNQAIYPYWSPSGSEIVHFEAENLISMEYPTLYRAIWSASIDGRNVTKLLDVTKYIDADGPSEVRFIGWTYEGDLLISIFGFTPQSGNSFEKYFAIQLSNGSFVEFDSDTIPDFQYMNPLRRFIQDIGEEQEITSPDQIWMGNVSQNQISINNAETNANVNLTANSIDVFIWKPDSSGFFMISNHNLYHVDIPEGKVTQVDSGVSDFIDHFTWVKYER